MIPNVEVRPGGQVFWLPGPKANATGWQEVTDSAPRFLWESCRLAEGVTLRDLFTILRRDIDLYEVIFGNWVKEIVSEGLDNEAEESDLSHLCLSWVVTVNDHWDEVAQENTEGKAVSGYTFPDFHGIGPGEEGTLPYSVSFTPLYKMMDLEVKLDRNFLISDEAEFYRTRRRTGEYPQRGEFDTTYQDSTFNLMQILYGIIWELSFFGGPTERDETAEDLKRRVEEVESGEAVTYSLDEVMESLEKKLNPGNEDD